MDKDLYKEHEKQKKLGKKDENEEKAQDTSQNYNFDKGQN